MLKFDGPNVRVINTGYKTTPVVIHGNGPSKLYLNHLSNYVPEAWSHEDGCLACNEDTINLQNIEVRYCMFVFLSFMVVVMDPVMNSKGHPPHTRTHA